MFRLSHQDARTARLWGLRAALWSLVAHGGAWAGFAAAVRAGADLSAGLAIGGVVGGALGAAGLIALERLVRSVTPALGREGGDAGR